MEDHEQIFQEIKRNRICPFEFAINTWSNSTKFDKLYAEQHPLGFIKIELTEILNGKSLSLHLWGSSDRTPIHCHHFDMESYVFRGELLDLEYQIEEHEGSSGLSRFELEYSENEKERIFHASAKQCAIRRTKNRLIKNSTYKVDKAIFHSTLAMDRNSASVIIRRNIGRTGSACLTSNTKHLAPQNETPLHQTQVLELLKKEKIDIV